MAGRLTLRRIQPSLVCRPAWQLWLQCTRLDWRLLAATKTTNEPYSRTKVHAAHTTGNNILRRSIWMASSCQGAEGAKVSKIGTWKSAQVSQTSSEPLLGPCPQTHSEPLRRSENSPKPFGTLQPTPRLLRTPDLIWTNTLQLSAVREKVLH